MTGALLKKELRALGPALLALSAAVLIASAQRHLSGLVAPIYFLGACALGALSLGYEYGYDTLSSALVLPVSRTRILLLKQLSLALALAVFLAVTNLVVNRSFASAWRAPLSDLLEPAIVALFVVPWLTMVFRSALAGAVFSIAIPLLIVVIAGSVRTMLHSSPQAAEALAIATGFPIVIALGAIGATMMWPTFLRLEALGPRDTHITERWSPTQSIARAASPQNRVWAQLKKELHLQQLPAAVALVYVAAIIGLALTRRGDMKGAMTLVVTEFYSAFIAVLAATSVTAKERELRTLDWQLSVPAPGIADWLIKLAVATATVVLLGLLLPFGMSHVLRLSLASFPADSIRAMVLSILGITVLAVYVSSLCRTALRAAIITLPAVLGTYFVTLYGTGRVAGWIILALPLHPHRAEYTIFGVFVAIFGGAALTLAYANHRSLDRSPNRIVMQIGALLIANLAALIGGPVLSQFI